jgi:hypothetical protein
MRDLGAITSRPGRLRLESAARAVASVWGVLRLLSLCLVGAGSDFDFGVNPGNGGGPNGNGTLEIARFVLGADSALALADVLALFPTRRVAGRA